MRRGSSEDAKIWPQRIFSLENLALILTSIISIKYRTNGFEGTAGPLLTLFELPQPRLRHEILYQSFLDSSCLCPISFPKIQTYQFSLLITILGMSNRSPRTKLTTDSESLKKFYFDCHVVRGIFNITTYNYKVMQSKSWTGPLAGTTPWSAGPISLPTRGAVKSPKHIVQLSIFNQEIT